MMTTQPGSQPFDKPEDIDAYSGNIENLKLTLEVWKKIIDVQQHFNDIEMRIRNAAVTVLTAVIGATGLALREPATVEVWGITITSATAVIFAGVVAWAAFYLMDRWWYHRLQQGAVNQAQDIEKKLRHKILGLDLSNAIREASGFKILGIRVGSNQRINLFYGVIFLLLLVLMVATSSIPTNP